MVYAIASGQPGGYDAHAAGLAANGFGEHSPGHFALGAGLLSEIVLTFIFLSVILGATSRSASTAQAGIAIGFTLTLIHLIGIPMTNVSVNPARSTGPALFVGGWALAQLWLFWLAPLGGAAICRRARALAAGDGERGDGGARRAARAPSRFRASRCPRRERGRRVRRRSRSAAGW